MHIDRKKGQKDTVINIRGHKIGEDNFLMMAGPCSIESRESKIGRAHV